MADKDDNDKHKDMFDKMGENASKAIDDFAAKQKMKADQEKNKAKQ